MTENNWGSSEEEKQRTGEERKTESRKIEERHGEGT